MSDGWPPTPCGCNLEGDVASGTNPRRAGAPCSYTASTVPRPAPSVPRELAASGLSGSPSRRRPGLWGPAPVRSSHWAGPAPAAAGGDWQFRCSSDMEAASLRAIRGCVARSSCTPRPTAHEGPGPAARIRRSARARSPPPQGWVSFPRARSSPPGEWISRSRSARTLGLNVPRETSGRHQCERTERRGRKAGVAPIYAWGA